MNWIVFYQVNIAVTFRHTEDTAHCVSKLAQTSNVHVETTYEWWKRDMFCDTMNCLFKWKHARMLPLVALHGASNI